jgi:hypothetical protein
MLTYNLTVATSSYHTIIDDNPNDSNFNLKLFLHELFPLL